MAELLSARPLSRVGEGSNPSSPADVVNGRLSAVAGIRRSAALSHSALPEFDRQPSTENDRTSKTDVAPQHTAVEDAAVKPVINDVKLISRDQLAGCSFTMSRRQSTLRTRLEPGRPSDDSCLTEMPSTRPSSTFNDVSQQNVYIGLGDYQTLLRPLRRVDEADETTDGVQTRRRVSNSNDNVDDEDDEETRTSYGDDTLRAIAVITQKYDSFKRRQVRVHSFLAARVSRSASRDSTSAADDDAVTLTRSAAAVAAVSLRRRLAAEHALTMSPPDDVTPEVVEGGHVTPAEVERAALFYSSLGSVVVVCRSLADVSVGSVGRAGDPRGAAGSDSVAGCRWIQLLTGVPVLVLGRRRRRELTLVVADRSTAMPLWRDRINCMSSLRQLLQPTAAGRDRDAAGTGGGGAALTMRVSGGLTKRVRLDVFSRCAAMEFMTAYATLTSDPDDELWNISHDTAPPHVSGVAGERRRRGQRGRETAAQTTSRTKTTPPSPLSAQPQTARPHRERAVTLGDVSRPCQPRWITRVDAADSNFRAAFADYLPVPAAAAPPTTGDAVTADSEFRPRLPTN